MWIRARSDAHSSVGSFSYGKRKAGEETPLLEELERLACGGQILLRSGIALLWGDQWSPGQASTEVWSPWDTGSVLSCLREEGLVEGVGCVFWVPRVGAPGQGILGAIGKSRHSPSCLGQDVTSFFAWEILRAPPKTMTSWESGHRPEW